MTDTEQKAAAKEFADRWKDWKDEKQGTQLFWVSLLQTVFGVEKPDEYIKFEMPVKLGHTSYIDGFIQDTKVLIEQKGAEINLRRGYPQSDGSLLTPFQQARRYAGNLPHDMNPRWIVICNFWSFEIHDMNRPNDDPEVILLENLPEEYYRLQFLAETGNAHTKREMEVSIAAGEIVGLLYDAFAKQYAEPESPKAMHSLNVLCVRLVFCLYAENAGIFGRYEMFHDYMAAYPTRKMRKALVELFHILDTPESERDEFLADDDPELAAFPYVNGGLFSDEDITIPPFTEEIRTLLLDRASAGFNWSEISPTIFGAVFESTLNPETRRSGGMHYTSIENIHKVIDPLFLDGLHAEFDEISAITVDRTREKRLRAFQDKLASLEFLDPAAGSGNFLTETYLSLRRLENQVIALLQKNQITLGEVKDPIKVSISQFYGIEINDFAVTVAKTALWIAESQMMHETEAIVRTTLDFLPLKTNANIVEGNALRLDWESVVPKRGLNYIMGNPPFVGYSLQSKSQKEDILSVYVDEKGKRYKTAGKIDYVAGWYFKAAQLMQGTSVRTAFVSTNSITQGEQVSGVWKPLYDRFGIHIDFAHRTFRWDSEASLKAHVHCVIIGFSVAPNQKPRQIFEDDRCRVVGNINAYLIDAPDVFVNSRKNSICDVPPMVYGNKPADGGNLFLSLEEYEQAIKVEPEIAQYIKQIYGSAEYINNKQRYCLWLVGASPDSIRKSKFISSRVAKVYEFRKSSPKEATQKSAERPTLFQEIRQPDTEYIIVPRVSSERRRYCY